MTFLVIGSQYVSSCTFHCDTSNWGWLLKIYLVFQKKKKILLLLTWVRYIWYQSQVETLANNWAQNAPACFTLELHVYWPWSCAGEAGTLAQNHNEDDPIPWQCYVRPEHVSTQVSGYSLAHLRICLQIAKMIASYLFWLAPIKKKIQINNKLVEFKLN